jgi:glycosyltransferase involved in cell wall biosynthesis
MPRLLYDLTGLLHWYAYFRRPAGVQRVVEQVAACAVVQGAGRTHPELSVEFVVRTLGTSDFYVLDPALVLALSHDRPSAISCLRRLFAKTMALSTLRGTFAEGRYFHWPYLALGLLRMDSVLDAGSAIRVPGTGLKAVAPPTAEDTYFNPGDLWWQKRYVAAIGDLKKRTGVRILQMIHDLYVLHRPEWQPTGFSNVFADQVRGIAPLVDGWLTSSSFVKAQIAQCLRDWALPERPIDVLPMGWDSFARAPVRAPIGDQAILDRHGVGRQPFILFVGTVEPRKNLSLLLDAMEALRHRFGNQVPALVVAGGYGWRAQSVRRRLLREMGRGHLFWVKNISDEELRTLYRRARFAVMPSHGEGWGLAVQESIALGLPCIATSGGATREAGRDLARYFDPARPEELETAMAFWIVNDAALASARARIARALKTESFPTWNDAGRTLLALAFPPSDSS